MNAICVCFAWKKELNFSISKVRAKKASAEIEKENNKTRLIRVLPDNSYQLYIRQFILDNSINFILTVKEIIISSQFLLPFLPPFCPPFSSSLLMLAAESQSLDRVVGDSITIHSSKGYKSYTVISVGGQCASLAALLLQAASTSSDPRLLS